MGVRLGLHSEAGVILEQGAERVWGLRERRREEQTAQ